MPPLDRTVIVDATFPWKIAGELVARGYDATSPYELGDAGIKDPPLLSLIHATLEPAVLVTFDNKMPGEHRPLLDHYRTTLAVVDKDVPAGMTPEQYWRDVIHRNAHRFVVQASGTLFIYRQRRRRLIP